MIQEVCASCGSPLREGVKFCSSCGTVVEQSLSLKATKHPMSSKAKTSYTVLTIGLVGFFTYVFVQHLPGKPNPVIEKQPEVAMAATYNDVKFEQQPIESKVENGKIIIPLNKVLE